MDVSRARRRVNALYQRIGARLETLLDRSPLFAASLYEHKTQCGRPQCKCAQGPYRHRQWCVSFVEEGRSRTRVVPRALRPAVGTLTRDYRRFRQARREVQRLFEELLEAVDALRQARCAAGTRRYARLIANAKGARGRSKQGG